MCGNRLKNIFVQKDGWCLNFKYYPGLSVYEYQFHAFMVVVRVKRLNQIIPCRVRHFSSYSQSVLIVQCKLGEYASSCVTCETFFVEMIRKPAMVSYSNLTRESRTSWAEVSNTSKGLF